MAAAKWVITSNVTRAGSDSISTCDGGLVTVYRAPPLPFSQCALSQVLVLIWVSVLLEATAVCFHADGTVGKLPLANGWLFSLFGVSYWLCKRPREKLSWPRSEDAVVLQLQDFFESLTPQCWWQRASCNPHHCQGWAGQTEKSSFAAQRLVGYSLCSGLWSWLFFLYSDGAASELRNA